MHFYLYLNGVKQYPGKIITMGYADELYDSLKKENSDEETKVLNPGIHIQVYLHDNGREVLYQCTDREILWNVKPVRQHQPKEE